METLINLLVEKVGLDTSQAKKVVDLLTEHAADIPQWLGKGGLSGVADKLPGGLGSMLGGD